MPIICGTDFSPRAAEACQVAAALAGRLQEPLVLVHVVEEAAPLLGDDAVRSALLDGARARLDEAAAAVKGLAADVRTKVLMGAPDEQLVRLGEGAGARLLVVSSLGRRAPARWLLGSTAERVSQSSRVPVLVVRDSKPFLAWARGERRLRVVAGVDASRSADAALGWLRGLDALGQCDIVLAHVYWPPAEHRRLGIAEPFYLAEGHPEAETLLRRQLAARAKDILGETKLRVRVQGGLGLTAQHLVSLAEDEGADLLIVGTHQRQGASRLWYGAVSRGAVNLAPMSVACVPLAAAPAAEARELPRIRRVLAPTDFSPCGNAAVLYAYSVAASGGTVHLCHVIEPLSVPNPLYAHYSPGRAPTPEEHARQRSEIEAKLRSLAPEQASEHGIDTVVEVFEAADVAEGIAALGERLDADLICMGSHGRTGLSRVFAGSVAQAVVKQTKRAVLLARPGPER
jgi:nucleotide-binding universal stress UspA family protein